MTVHVLSLVLLALMFAVASIWSVNLGVLALVGAFLVGTGLGELDADAILSGFPGDLFVLLVGVTYLFGIAQRNGSLQRIVDFGMRLVGNRRGATPWLMFVLTAFVAAAGALSAAAVAIVSPLAMRISEKYRISPLLMGLMVVQGATAGAFSPLSPFGAITNDLLRSSSLPQQQGSLFIGSFVFNLVLAVVVFCLFGGIRLIRNSNEPQAAQHDERALTSVGAGTATARTHAGSADENGNGDTGDSDIGDSKLSEAENTDDPRTADNATARVRAEQTITLLGIVALIVGATVFGLDVGFTALTIGLGLAAFGPERYSETVKNLPWSAVLLVCGMLTYVHVLEEVGSIEFLRQLVTVSGSPLVTALAAAYIGGIISAFASTAGVLGASIPLTVPLLETGLLPVTGTLLAVAIASSVVDVSPLSTNGALLVANQRTMDTRVFFRRLLLWAVPVTLLAPLVSWLLFVVL